MKQIWKFTMIELLIVISIIMILAALLLPALQRAKESGKRTLCMSNLKQCGLQIFMYTDDYNGYLPANESAAPKSYWARELRNIDKNINVKIFYCPSYPPTSPAEMATPTNQSYGLPILWNDTKLYQCVYPILLSDSTYYSVPPKQNYYINWTTLTSGALNSGCIYPRHFGKANCLIMDGRVENLNKNRISSSPYTWYSGSYEMRFQYFE